MLTMMLPDTNSGPRDLHSKRLLLVARRRRKRAIPQAISSSPTRFIIGPKSTNLDLGPGKILFEKIVEFPRIDDRFAMTKHTKAFTCFMDPSLGTDFPFIMQVMGGGFPPYNSLAAMNLGTGKMEVYFPGPRYRPRMCVYTRRGSTEEADGYMMVLLNNYSEMISELAVLDTKDFERAVAIVELPLRLRAGLHGNWVDKGDEDGHPALAPIAVNEFH
jgi:carotenoid cleavage dioxygenase-like enzyme